MAVFAEYKILEYANLVYMVRTGAFEPGAMLRDIKKVTEDPLYKRGMNFFIDASGVDYADATYDNISQFKESWEEVNNRISPSRIGMFHVETVNFGIGRMSSSIFESEDVQRRPFRDRRECFDWLDLPVDFKPPIFDRIKGIS